MLLQFRGRTREKDNAISGLPLWQKIFLAFAACIAVAFLVSLFLVLRIDRFPLDVSQGSREDSEYNKFNDVWLIVGTDDRGKAPHFDELGPPEVNPGHRADIMFLARRDGQALHIMPVQRDIEVTWKDTTDRINFMFIPSAQRLSDAFCHDLHVPLDHMVVVNMNAFVSLVDALGGVSLTLEEGIKDEAAGLYLQAGEHILDGRGALQLIRARHPQYLRNGEWVSSDEFSGSIARRDAATAVLEKILEKSRDLNNPVTMLAAALVASGDLSVDEHTSMGELVSLARTSDVHFHPLEVTPTGRGLMTRVGVPGFDALGGAGMIGLCEVEIDDSNWPEKLTVEE